MVEKETTSIVKYSKAQTTNWLSWIARNMQAHNETVFLIEGMQISWIKSRFDKIIHWICTLIMIVLPVVLFMILLLSSINLWDDPKNPYSAVEMILIGLLLGLIIAIVFMIINRKGLIRTIESSKWSFRNIIKHGFKGMIKGGIGGILFGILLILVFSLIGDTDIQELHGIIMTGAIGCVAGAIAKGWKKSVPQTTTEPNEGMKLTRKNAFKGIAIGFIGGVIIFPLYYLLDNEIVLKSGKIIIYISERSLLIGGILGYISWLWFGGRSIIQHYVLRFLIYIRGYCPLNFRAFLDYTSDHLRFTQRVGGGYIFIHRMLQEHFAHKSEKE